MLTVGADMLVRLLPTTTELKLGVVAALFGAPLFLYIALRSQGDRDD
jgi:iron complex transport system permease protein